jgi:hypothetical protein
VNHSLLLIRNILHAPERPTQMADKRQDQQDQLVRILLAQGLDRLLISLLACAQKVNSLIISFEIFYFPASKIKVEELISWAEKVN